MKSELNIELLILETLSLMQIVLFSDVSFTINSKLFDLENNGLLEYIDFNNITAIILESTGNKCVFLKNCFISTKLTISLCLSFFERSSFTFYQKYLLSAIRLIFKSGKYSFLVFLKNLVSDFFALRKVSLKLRFFSLEIYYAIFTFSL